MQLNLLLDVLVLEQKRRLVIEVVPKVPPHLLSLVALISVGLHLEFVDHFFHLLYLLVHRKNFLAQSAICELCFLLGFQLPTFYFLE